MSEQNASSNARRRPWSRWLWFALVASVAINLLVVGAVAGFIVRHGPPGRGPMTGSIFGFVKSLPDERRRQFRRNTRDLRRQIRPLRRAVRHARRLADQVLVAEPFDRQAYALARQRIYQAKMKLWEAAQPLFVEMANGMTAGERRKFITWRNARRGRAGARFRNRGRGSAAPQSAPPLPPK